MRIHYVQHVPYESIGYIEEWLQENKVIITSTKIWEAISFPPLTDFDGLIIMGGPMNVDKEEVYPWLKKEKEFILAAVKSGKKIIGICLGAQLLATALGSKVYKNKHSEIGWFPVQINKSLGKWLNRETNNELTVFHWHGDTYDLPDSCINHITSKACTNQLFTLNDSIAGIQFHLEVTASTLKYMVENDPEEIIADQYVQDKNDILKGSRKEIHTEARLLLHAILNKIFLA